MSREDSIIDDTSSIGNKEEDDDDEDDANDDEKFESLSGDPERLKAFNVRIHFMVLIELLLLNRGQYKAVTSNVNSNFPCI